MKHTGLRYLLFSALMSVCLYSFILAGEDFIYKADGRRDPMIPLVTPQGLIRDIKSLEGRNGIFLEGIIYDAQGKSMAIINGEVTVDGDSIGEIKILEVKKDSVIILKGNQVEVLKLEEAE